jgi:hypothetical protein
MGGLETLVSTLGLSFASGINLYATVLVVGLAERYGWFTFLPDELKVLGDPIILWIAGILYALEFFADKIPFVSTIWDGFHTFIRPLGAAALALGAAKQFGPVGQTAAFLIGGAVALGSHTTKASARVLAHTAPEPATHSVISVAEDLGVVGLLALVYTHPWAALAVLIGLLTAMAFVTPLLLRTLRFVLRSFFGVIGSWLEFEPSSGLARPPWLETRLAERAPGAEWRVFRGFARNVPGMPRLARGFLAVTGDRALFARKGMLTKKVVDLGDPRKLEIETGVICDIVTAPLADSDARICMTKDWAKLYRAAAQSEPSFASQTDHPSRDRKGAVLPGPA